MKTKKLIFVLFILLQFVIFLNQSKAQNTDNAPGDFISMPYFGEKKIKFFRTSNASLHYELNLATEFANFPIPFAGAGPNATAIYDSKLFISFDKDLNQGGVLIYNYSDIYPVRNANPPKIISTAPVAGIAIHPVTGDLYAAKFQVNGQSGRITKYTKASGYASSSAVDLPVPEYYTNYFTGIAFDSQGNLWTGDLEGHRLVVYTALSLFNGFIVIGNGNLTYNAPSLSGGSINVKLFSAPEGFVFDSQGNLWVTNNNDWARTNGIGEGTYVKIAKAYLDVVTTSPLSGTHGNKMLAVIYTVPTQHASVYHIQNAKFGGTAISNNTLFFNDQGNGLVWKWNTSTAYNSTNCVTSGISTTYPGFGGFAFNDISFPLAVTLTSQVVPNTFDLKQNFPNPFNPNTTIRFDVPSKSGNVKLSVYDLNGKELEVLVNENLQSGSYEVNWNASGFPSGIYFYRINSEKFSVTKKMNLIK